MRQRELEIALQALPAFRSPKASLEQYPTPAKVAADVLYTAKALGDIEGRSVADLGCGTGALAIGATLLGAARVAAIDIEASAVELAREEATRLGLDIAFIVGDVSSMEGRFDTILQNPPFGAQSKGADMPFMEKAMELATGAIYTFYNPPSREHLVRAFARSGWDVTHEKNYKFKLRHTFNFHRRESRDLDVGLLRLAPGRR